MNKGRKTIARVCIARLQDVGEKTPSFFFTVCVSIIHLFMKEKLYILSNINISGFYNYLYENLEHFRHIV